MLYVTDNDGGFAFPVHFYYPVSPVPSNAYSGSLLKLFSGMFVAL
jgi:hypothetical protein